MAIGCENIRAIVAALMMSSRLMSAKIAATMQSLATIQKDRLGQRLTMPGCVFTAIERILSLDLRDDPTGTIRSPYSRISDAIWARGAAWSTPPRRMNRTGDWSLLVRAQVDLPVRRH
jgi:hypothetical protein